jgi:hypothetical protein
MYCSTFKRPDYVPCCALRCVWLCVDERRRGLRTQRARSAAPQRAAEDTGAVSGWCWRGGRRRWCQHGRSQALRLSASALRPRKLGRRHGAAPETTAERALAAPARALAVVVAVPNIPRGGEELTARSRAGRAGASRGSSSCCLGRSPPSTARARTPARAARLKLDAGSSGRAPHTLRAGARVTRLRDGRHRPPTIQRRRGGPAPCTHSIVGHAHRPRGLSGQTAASASTLGALGVGAAGGAVALRVGALGAARRRRSSNALHATVRLGSVPCRPPCPHAEMCVRVMPPVRH